MKFKSTLNASTLSITIEGHVTGIHEMGEIKHHLELNPAVDTIELIIKDAFVIPSSLIGYLVKIVKKDKKRVILKAEHQELKNLLSDLNLDRIIEVK